MDTTKRDIEVTYATSETSKFRHLTAPYCVGCGIDIGSSGDPVTPSAISLDMAQPYCPALGPSPIHLRGDGRQLGRWFRLASLDYVYSSHLLEDFADWQRILWGWMEYVALGGHLVLLVPDRERWKAALDRGQPPNDAHKHEFTLGELTSAVSEVEEWSVLKECHPDPQDYSILFVARRAA